MPREKFTSATAAKLPIPEKGQTDYFDTALRNFGCRVGFGGKKTWFVMFRIKGDWTFNPKTGKPERKKYRMNIGPADAMTLAVAREEARKAIQAAALGEDPRPKTPERIGPEAMTFAELGNAYVEQYSKPHKKSWRNDVQRLNHDIIPAFGHKIAVDVTAADVQAMVDAMMSREVGTGENRRKVGPGANKSWELARAIFNWGKVKKKLPFVTNPAAEVGRPTKPGERDRVLNSDELRGLWAALDEEEKRVPVAVGVIRFMLLSAQRGGQIREMKWEHLDLTDGFWNAPAGATKTDRPYRVPLTPWMREIIDSMKERDKVYVFPAARSSAPLPKNTHQKLIKRVEASADIKDLRPHDLRGTVASHLAASGFSLESIGRLLHHASEKRMTAKYVNYSFDNEKAQALAAWERRFRAILAGEQIGNNVVAIRA